MAGRVKPDTTGSYMGDKTSMRIRGKKSRMTSLVGGKMRRRTSGKKSRRTSCNRRRTKSRAHVSRRESRKSTMQINQPKRFIQKLS